MGRTLVIQGRDGFGQLHADTEPTSIDAAVVAAPRPFRLQFDEPLPEAVLAATSDVLARNPDEVLRAYGREVDASLAWLSGFEHIRQCMRATVVRRLA